MSPRRKELMRHGRRGQGLVRVVEGAHRGALVYWVLYRAQGRRQAMFPRTKAGRAEALAFAQGVIEAQARPVVAAPTPVTVEELFRAFLAENAAHLRPNTIRIYRETWAKFQNRVGPHVPARDCTRENLVELRRDLEARGLAVNTMRRIFVTVRHVYRWGEDTGLVPPSTVLRYVFRVGKDRRPVAPAEYRLAEFEAIIAACPLDGPRWRAGAVLRLCGYQGARQHAVLHLDWRDVDWSRDEIHWRAAWDKVGRDWSQPMRRATRVTLEWLWTRAGEPTTGWLFPAPRGEGKVYSIQSLWAALRSAERAAGVDHRERRAGHGLRRMLAGDVAALTGNPKDALDAIGDSDTRQMERYVQPRRERMRAIFEALDQRPESAYEVHTGEAGA